MLNLLPIIVNVLFLPIWFIENQTGLTSGMISYIEMVFNTLVAPVFLLIINFYLCRKQNRPIWQIYVVMFTVTVISGIIYYVNWGVDTGRLYNPDGMTIALMQLTIVVPTIVITLVSIIIKLVTFLKK